MKKIQFDQLVIHDYGEKTFHLPLHSHTYYELVYIRKGNGIHFLNNNRFPYRKGDLFIISPEDEHYFEIYKNTHFTFIKFTDTYLSEHSQHAGNKFNLYEPARIMRDKLLKEVKLKIDEPSNSILQNIIENIVLYKSSSDLSRSKLIYYHILSIFTIISEAAAKLHIRIDNGQPDKEELISFIHQHIYQPSIIQIKNIAAHFSIANSYFSDYFKKKFGISYRNYVNDYRLNLIQTRLTIPTVSLPQIVDEFGFTDESHLNKFFKNHKGLTPKVYRKLHLENAL
jgi:AraC-type DNA-binding domain-containing proteins